MFEMQGENDAELPKRPCRAAGMKRVKFRFWVSDPFKIAAALTAGESVMHKEQRVMTEKSFCNNAER